MGTNVSPWWQIWIRPRNTIRAILESANPERHMILIAVLSGVINALNRTSIRNLGDQHSLTFIALLSLIGGSIAGIIGLYLTSAVLKITGGWLGGRGTYSDLRVAITRGVNAPATLIGLLWVLELILFGKEMFTTVTPRIDHSSTLSLTLLLISLLEVVLAIWVFVIACKSIGEAHQFSALKAFWSALIPGIILVGVIVLFVALAGFLL